MSDPLLAYLWRHGQCEHPTTRGRTKFPGTHLADDKTDDLFAGFGDQTEPLLFLAYHIVLKDPAPIGGLCLRGVHIIQCDDGIEVGWNGIAYGNLIAHFYTLNESCVFATA